MVLFESERTGNADLYAKPADGSAPETLLLDGDRSLQGGRWSRDGSWIVAREGGGGISPEEGNRDIIAFRPGVDTALMPVVATAADEVAPALSPDGRYLAYVSDESGRPEVYVRPFPDAGRAKWQVSVGGGIEPLWAHSGRELFYRSSGALTVASLTAGPGFGIGERRELFRLDWAFPVRPAHRGYDIAPDDRRFVMIKRRAGETLEIVLIENWFEELEARVGR
jgi:Tol biopolymer transport system component